MRTLVLVAITIMLTGAMQAQSLSETFDWMTNTLRPSEGNSWYIHHPTPQPYPKDWVDKQINPYHQEIIRTFSHDSCKVTFVVSVIDNDMGLLLGKYIDETQTDTFDLSTIDPNTIKVTNSCEPIDTPTGKATPWNCTDDAGLQMEFKTRNAKPTIRRESVESSHESAYGLWKDDHEPKYSRKQMCKDFPNNSAYCDEPEHKETPLSLTSDSLVFHSPEYTERFIKAFRHAVELCGGKPSTF
jgi:hypothetical protein